MKATVLLETEDLLFYNKPAGMLVIPDRMGSDVPVLKKQAEQYVGHPVFIIHRIDRDTSGVVAIAKNAEAHKFYNTQFQNHEVVKYYDAIVVGRPQVSQGTIETPIVEHPAIKGKMMVAKKGKAARTQYEVMAQWPLFAHMRVRIFTGRTHQIRVHLSSIGLPIVADELYGDGQPFLLSNIKKKYKLSRHDESEQPILSRMALHASSLMLKDKDGENISAEAPLPKEFKAIFNQLNKHSKL